MPSPLIDAYGVTERHFDYALPRYVTAICRRCPRQYGTAIAAAILIAMLIADYTR